MHLRDYVLGHCDDLQLSATEAREVIDALPGALRKAPCFRNLLTGQRCYEYGAPFGLPDEKVVFGSTQVLPVDDLIKATQAARHYLPSSDWDAIIQRLEDFEKHFEAMAELHPLTLAKGVRTAKHEVPASGNRTVDWRFEWEDGTTMLLEVKSRIYNLIGTLASFDPSDSSSLVPCTDPEKLFRDVIGKFPINGPSDVVQGAWLQVLVKQEKRGLDNYFAQLDQRRLHFAIIWSGDTSQLEAYVVHRQDVDGRAVLYRFGLQQSETIVFEKGSDA